MGVRFNSKKKIVAKTENNGHDISYEDIPQQFKSSWINHALRKENPRTPKVILSYKQRGY